MFAWTPADMPSIDPVVMTHRLSVKPTYQPVKQKKRSFTPKWQKVITKDVDKLLDAGFVREVSYPDWIANVVLVKKTNGK